MPGKKGSDLGQRRQQFWDSLHTEKSDIIRRGLTSGAVALTTTNDDGMTGLQVAALLGKERSVSAILDFAHRVRGAAEAIDTLDENEGQTALHKAAAEGHLGCVKLLLRAGARQMKDENGKTPRDLAVAGNYVKIVEFLDRGESSEEEDDGDAAGGEEGESSTHKNREKKRQIKEKAEKQRLAAVAAAAAAMENTSISGDSASVATSSATTTTAAAAAQQQQQQAIQVNWSAEPTWEELKVHLSTGRQDVTLNKMDLDASKAKVDDALWRCTSITRLALRMPEGTLSELNPGIGVMTRLTTLILSRNAIGALPTSFCNLGKNLKVLEISHNKLKELPTGLCNLEVLDAAFNELTNVEALSSLTTLLSLNLDGNKLQGALPLNYSALKRLATLSASHNALTSMHWGIGFLQSLTELNLANNQISNIPTELSDLSDKKLKKINLDNNPLCDPKALKILQKGKNPIKEILMHVKKVNAPRKTEDGTATGGGRKKKKQQQSESEEEEEENDNDGDDEDDGPAARG